LTTSAIALSPSWSADGKSLYYTPSLEGEVRVAKVSIDGGDTKIVRTDHALSIGGRRDGGLFYASRIRPDNWEFDFRSATPDDGPSRTIFRLTAARFPVDRSLMSAVASPDEKWLAMSLIDGPTTNIWVVSTDSGEARRVTDFDEHAVVIARRLSWSPDSQHIYAAVAEQDADVVLLDGVL
jgi:Tol biopolymer transport system component